MNVIVSQYMQPNTNDIGIFVGNKAIQMDVKPVIDNGRTLVPLRAIFEALNTEINWDGVTKTITANKNDTDISIQIGNKKAIINGEDIVLDVPAKIVNGRTLVPVRFVSEALGCKVAWDGKSYSVVIDEK